MYRTLDPSRSAIAMASLLCLASHLLTFDIEIIISGLIFIIFMIKDIDQLYYKQDEKHLRTHEHGMTGMSTTVADGQPDGELKNACLHKKYIPNELKLPYLSTYIRLVLKH